MSASWPIAAAHSKNFDVMIDQVCNKMSPTEVIASLDDYHPKPNANLLHYRRASR